MNFREIQERARAEWAKFQSEDRPRILVGAGTCGRAAGAEEALEVIREFVADNGLDVAIHEVGCLGLCYAEPELELSAPGRPSVLYGDINAEKVSDLLQRYFLEDDLCADLAIAVMDGEAVDGVPAFQDLPMMQGQTRIVARNSGRIDPQEINHYIARDGYQGLARALDMGPEEVIDEVKAAGLRGRGGAGFPTGAKWGFCRNSAGKSKYMVCNADEGDPGAFMDRSVIESDPHSLIEGMTIAAYAIGAEQGYIYIRAEYPLAIERLHTAIAQAQELGLVGDSIMGSDFTFNLQLKQGAGAFVCGEETALMASIEGDRGTPRPRPPFPAQSGLHGNPTNINNVETLANVPCILQNGPEWYRKFGTESSPGTKTFALAGKIERTGLIEVPLGTRLRDIVYDIGGGVPDGKKFKAVQTGGPSGGCIPARLLDLPVDYENLKEAGSIMGSGGMIVMDEDTCMVDIARYFIEFTQSESCGKCPPCRLGTTQMLSLLNKITRGEGQQQDVDLLEEIGDAVKQASLCGLGQTAPNPVLTTLEYFPEEYGAHLKGKCPAAVCPEMVEAACKHTCPAGVDVPRYIRCIADGRYGEALDVIREKIPLPAVCGYVCFHPCESKCRRGLLDDPVAVRALKRFAADKGYETATQGLPATQPTGKKVAVVGSGPAGLTGAYYLARKGHEVTVFEKSVSPGGLLRLGIPAYRLPRDVLDRDIEWVKRAGVEIKTGAEVSSPHGLLDKGFDAVFLAVGAQKGMKMGIPGDDLPDVHDCMSFLRQVNAGEQVDTGDRVLVVGGGDAAVDTARMALRNGAAEVKILYRRSRAEMPAADEELRDAEEEGVSFDLLTQPVEIRRENGRLEVACVRMELGPMDSSGRPRPEPISDSNFTIEADSLVMAIGQQPAGIDDWGIEVDRRSRVKVHEDEMATSRKGLFAAGDMVTGPASVIEAVAAGRRAASAIDRYLGGDGDIEEQLAPAEETALGVLEEQEERRREEIPRRTACERLRDGGLVEKTYSEKSARAEAERCLRCDLEEEFED